MSQDHHYINISISIYKLFIAINFFFIFSKNFRDSRIFVTHDSKTFQRRRTQKNVLWNQQKFGWPKKIFRLNMDHWKFFLNNQKNIVDFFAIPTKKNLHRQQKTSNCKLK